MQSERNQKSATNYTILNNKLPYMALDITVYHGPKIKFDHYLVVLHCSIQA